MCILLFYMYTGLAGAVFAAVVPNSADKPLLEVVEEIMGDHEMMVCFSHIHTQLLFVHTIFRHYPCLTLWISQSCLDFSCIIAYARKLQNSYIG